MNNRAIVYLGDFVSEWNNLSASLHPFTDNNYTPKGVYVLYKFSVKSK